MKLSDYINYRNRGKKVKNTNYMIRTQHFYDGKPTTNPMTTGIDANFMNTLDIPSVSYIANAQKQHFKKIYMNLKEYQDGLLDKLNKSIQPSYINAINNQLEATTLKIIKEFEKGVDRLLSSSKNLKKAIEEKNTSTIGTYDLQLRQAFYSLKQIVNSIIMDKSHKIPALRANQWLKELEDNISFMEQAYFNNGSSSSVLFQNKDFLLSKKDGKVGSFLERLGYLSKNIKGLELLEWEGLDFFRRLPIPEDIEVINTGQIVHSGNLPLSQDGIIIDKNINMKLSNGKTVNLATYLKELSSQSLTKTINIDESDYQNMLQYIVGIQSKYHRGGYIQSSAKISLKQIIGTAGRYSKALRYLYILTQGEKGYEGKNITHSFNVSKSPKALGHYKALFSLQLSHFMKSITGNNFYMITQKGIQDSRSYYLDLFLRNNYFAPIGPVDIYNIEKEYRIAINELK